mmetsp:Transcript_2250/g.3339  ORF Transcript_2250/g.3339 Transcript_2250/m.3339 type:complete len:137 (-) Transcript_2250:209-619(-)
MGTGAVVAMGTGAMVAMGTGAVVAVMETGVLEEGPAMANLQVDMAKGPAMADHHTLAAVVEIAMVDVLVVMVVDVVGATENAGGTNKEMVAGVATSLGDSRRKSVTENAIMMQMVAHHWHNVSYLDLCRPKQVNLL